MDLRKMKQRARGSWSQSAEDIKSSKKADPSSSILEDALTVMGNKEWLLIIQQPESLDLSFFKDVCLMMKDETCRLPNAKPRF